MATESRHTPPGIGSVRNLVLCSTVLAMIACGGSQDGTKPGSGANEAASSPSTASSGSTGAASEFGSAMDGDHAVITQQAVGPLRVGDWRRPVMSFVYPVSARTGLDSENIIVVRGIGKDTVALSFRNDTLRRILVTYPGPHTSDGIGIGTPFASVAGQTGAAITKRGSARVVTLGRFCGVEFATDTTALTDSTSTHEKRGRDTTFIRAIGVGYCRK